MTQQEAAETMRRLEETTTAAMVGWAKAATEVERLTVELACMTAERDGYRTQLSADWQAKQISDLMAAAGQAREERDEALARAERHRQARDAIGDPFARIGIIVDEWQENGGDPYDAMKAIAEQVGEP